MDKYDTQINKIADLAVKKINVVIDMWSCGDGLFQFCKPDNTPVNDRTSYGCLTMIKSSLGVKYQAYTLELTQEIVSDPSIHREIDDLVLALQMASREERIKLLEPYAVYQRRMDEMWHRG